MPRRLLACASGLFLVGVWAIHVRADVACVATVLNRFLAAEAEGPRQYRALRHLEARSEQGGRSGWMDVRTEADGSGFRYRIVDDGGSGQVRSRVFLPALAAERQMWISHAPERAAINRQNYTFEECAELDDSGLTRINVKPRRKDVLLVEGSIFVRPDDGELMRVEGWLSKTPSFWTRRVEVVRIYERIAGVRLPVAFATTANLFLAGKATFTMTYTYDMVNGQPVSEPLSSP